MLYSLTDKLQFAENPQIQIKDTILTVKADARTVLKLMEIVTTKGENEAALEAASLLFAPKDKKALDALNLSMTDYTQVLATAMALAAGEDPDAPAEG